MLYCVLCHKNVTPETPFLFVKKEREWELEHKKCRDRLEEAKKKIQRCLYCREKVDFESNDKGGAYPSSHRGQPWTDKQILERASWTIPRCFHGDCYDKHDMTHNVSGVKTCSHCEKTICWYTNMNPENYYCFDCKPEKGKPLKEA